MAMNTATHTADVITPNFGTISAPTTAPRATPAQRRRQHADNRLIELCMDITANRAAADGAFVADPSGSSDFAAAWYDIYRSRADRAMKCATKVKARTADGLRSKARVVEILQRDFEGLVAEPEGVAFLASFTADVIRMQRSMLDQKISHIRFPGPRT
jgi:hypothetical protein